MIPFNPYSLIVNLTSTEEHVPFKHLLVALGINGINSQRISFALPAIISFAGVQTQQALGWNQRHRGPEAGPQLHAH